jgi:hypothetical protein
MVYTVSLPSANGCAFKSHGSPATSVDSKHIGDLSLQQLTFMVQRGSQINEQTMI